MVGTGVGVFVGTGVAVGGTGVPVGVDGTPDGVGVEDGEVAVGDVTPDLGVTPHKIWNLTTMVL